MTLWSRILTATLAAFGGRRMSSHAPSPHNFVNGPSASFSPSSRSGGGHSHGTSPSAWVAKTNCKNAAGKAIKAGADHSGHNHRQLDNHGHDHGDPYLVRQATCGDWIPLIKGYTASQGSHGGTYVRVFSDHTTTAQVDAVIKRDGKVLEKVSVEGHLHVGKCTASPMPDFDGNVRPDTSGKHWMNSKNKEVHFHFTTDESGLTDAMSCPAYEVSRTAMSVVLHENDQNAIAANKNAKKLCCDLTWDAEDRKDPEASSGSQAAATLAVASLTLLAGVVSL